MQYMKPPHACVAFSLNLFIFVKTDDYVEVDQTPIWYLTRFAGCDALCGERSFLEDRA